MPAAHLEISEGGGLWKESMARAEMELWESESGNSMGAFPRTLYKRKIIVSYFRGL